MFHNLLPLQADNHFQGRKLGLWLLGILLLLLTAMGVNSVFNGYYVATNVDGLPLNSYTAAGAQAVVSFYAIWGLAQLIIIAFSIVVLVRYRALVSFVFLLLLIEQVFWRVIHHALPIAKPGVSHGSWFLNALLALTVFGFLLSLWKRRGKV